MRSLLWETVHNDISLQKLLKELFRRSELHRVAIVVKVLELAISLIDRVHILHALPRRIGLPFVWGGEFGHIDHELKEPKAAGP
jgi:hypothetical protein